MADVKYRIELRQIEVKGLNARHYFWVKTRVDIDPTKTNPKDREQITVLGELHGFPRDPETGEVRGFSMGGDNLSLVDTTGPSTHFESSKRLPHVVAFEGTKSEVDRRWNAGLEMGEYLNKTGTEYNPLEDNSNALNTTTGKAMGLRPRKIFDPRVGGEAVQPFTPGLGRDMSAGRPDAPRSMFRRAPKDVGGYGRLDRDAEGRERTLDPFADPFRTDTPF